MAGFTLTHNNSKRGNAGKRLFVCSEIKKLLTRLYEYGINDKLMHLLFACISIARDCWGVEVPITYARWLAHGHKVSSQVKLDFESHFSLFILGGVSKTKGGRNGKIFGFKVVISMQMTNVVKSIDPTLKPKWMGGWMDAWAFECGWTGGRPTPSGGMGGKIRRFFLFGCGVR